MTTSTTTVNDNNTTTDLSVTTIAVNATINLNNSGGDDNVTTDGTGTTTVNANNSGGDDTITVNNAGNATVNLNNSTGSDDVDISDMSGAPLTTTVNLNNSTGKDDDVDIAGTTVNATVNMNNSGIAGYGDDVSVTGGNVTATVNLNNSAGNDDINIAGSNSTNATVNLNNSGGNDHVSIGSATGATTATVNLNASGGTDIVDILGATTTATVNLANSTGRGDVVMLVGKGVGTINAANSTGNDTLIGANSTDTITGGIGSDTLDLEGAGTIYSGTGNDIGIYRLSDHYSLVGGALQSRNGDVDYYYGQGGLDTLRIILTQDQYNLPAVQTDLAKYSTFLATNPCANPTFTFHFGASTGSLVVAGWQKLAIAVVNAAISGAAQEGQTLTASVIATGGETGSATFQWQELVGGNWVNLAGATAPSYVTKEADEGFELKVQAQYTDEIGQTITIYSAPTSMVLDAAPTVTTPVISGTAQEGQMLTALASAGQSDNPVTYQWQQDGHDITGATGATYTVTEADEGHTIDVVATTTNDNGVTISATSAATSTVLDAAPTVTTPVISGTAQQGQTLTAAASTGQNDNPVTYQWQRDGSNIASATGASYVVTEGDEGHKLDVVATATNDNGVTVSATSAATSTVLDAAPTVTTPVISGTPQEGQTLRAAASSGQSDNPVTYAWYSSADNFTNPIGSGATYTVKEADEGFTIDVKATAANDNGVTTSKTSAATSAVLDAAPTVTTPVISGTAQEGQTLTASASSGQADNPVSYAWYSSADNYTNPIGSGSTYALQEGDEGHQLEVKVTTTNDNGVTISATSAATSKVLDAAPTVTTPVISGTAQEGQTLTAAASSGQNDNPVSYTWYRSADNYTNPIGSGSTYLVKEADEGFAIEVKATVTNDNGVTISATSAAISTVLDAAPTVTTPMISGSAQEGQTLAAAAAAGQNDNPVTYQWQQDGHDIAGATGASYLVTEADEGHTIDVVATATNDNGVTISATSAATAAIIDAAPTVTTPVISGTAQEGQTLTASASSGQADNPVSYAWYSSADNFTNAIGAGSTYAVQESDEGHQLEVKATATNEQGLTTTQTSLATAAIIDAAPTVTTPMISGSAQEGQTLTAAAAAGQNDNPVTYQWQQDGHDITGATGASYVVTEGDEGHTIDVVATATNDNGVTISATSAATSTVLDAAPTVTTPVISGTVQEGQTLTASASSGQADNPVSYAWYSSADNYTNLIGSGSTYTVQESDEGRQLEVKATATNEQGLTTTQTSLATAAIIDAAPTVTTPVISGTVQEGQTLTAAAAAEQNDNPVTYQWQQDGHDITGATGASYVVTEGDEGHTIDVVATATNDNGVTISATSAATSTVLDAASTVTTPVISGTAQEGQTLTASASSGQADNPVTYQWQRDGSNITGATGASYQVTEVDEGHTIDVVATATNDNGVTISATSTATSTVLDAAPTVTTPVISGTVQEGQTLTASASSGQADNPVSYAWYSSADNFTNPIGTGSTYAVQESDEGHQLEVKATTTNDNGVTISATSAATSTVLDAAPTVTTPVISGTVQEGQTLTAAAAAGQNDNPVTYQWQQGGHDIAGATGASYLVTEADEGHTIDVVATATNDNGVTISATSAATAAIIDAAPTVTTPVISGTAQEGQTLTASAFSGQADNPVSYAWYSSADNFTNAIGAGSTYAVQESDEGHQLEVKATATNEQGLTTTQTSLATAAIIDAAPTVTTPMISGSAQEGQTLTAAAAAGQNDNPVTYQWQQDGHDITGATGASYVVTEGDEGHTIDVVATATNDNGVTISATSAATSTVLDAAPTVTTPVISGTAQEGQTLTAAAAAGQNDNPVTYQWQQDGHDITGATGASYVVTEGDEGHTIDVVATATNDNGVTISATSAATSTVLDAAPTVTTPVISGTAQEGQTLTASASSGQADNPVSYAWYSSADNYTNPIGSGSTYTVQESDEGRQLEVKATATNEQGLTTTQTSLATAAIIDAAPTVTTPVISGTVQEGQTLTASASSGQSDNPVSYAWYSSRDGYTTAIGTGSTYLVKEGDEGFTIEVKATATNDNGVTATATSAATAAVFDAAPTVSIPVITGIAQEGQTLTASASAGQTDNTVHYQWQQNGVNIAGATGATYVVQEADEGHQLDVVATVINEQGLAASAISAATSTVLDAAPTVTTPTISGTAQEGQTLTATASSGQSDNPVTYQWQRDGSNIVGATGATYLVTETDEGHHIDAVATATNDNGVTASATSTATSAVLDAAPTVTTPTITGTAQEGQTLTASASSGQSDNPVSYAWYSSRDGYTTAIGTGSTYLVKEGDEGFTIEVKATATNDNGVTATATSAATAAVFDAAPTVSIPVITGIAQEGQTLTASASAGQTDNTVHYQWQQNGVNIAGATGATYVVQEADEGHQLDVVATVINEQGLAASAISAATSTVLDAAPTVTTPTISGTAQEGQTLTATASSGQSDNPVTYQWQRDGSNIVGATGATYLVTETDEGHHIDAVATATNDNGVTASATSTATSAVLDAAPTVTTPTITGTAQEGQTLTASASSGQADNPVTYQWQRDGSNIVGATGATYLVTETDEGHHIDAVATATNDNGVTASATSTATSAVLDAAPTVTTPTITGTAQEGQTLTASASSGQSDNPVSYAWYSSRDGYTTAIGTGSTYLVKEGDEGFTIEVKATATNDNGVTATATSAATAAVFDAAPTVSIPVITGIAQEGQTLTASASAGQTDNTVHYQWQQNGVNIAGATGATYVVQEADEGHQLDVVATVTNEQGLAASAISAATSTVLDAAPTVTTPTISGTAQEGQTLTASASSGQADNAVSYAWYSSKDGYTTAIGTGSTYLVKEANDGFTIEAKATATNDNGVTVSATSAATAAVTDQPITTTITGTSVSGGSTHVGTATFTINFAEAVTGLTGSNYTNYFALNTTGPQPASFKSFTENSGSTYTITATYPDGGAHNDLGSNLTLTFTNTNPFIVDSETGESSNKALNGSGTITNLQPAGIAGSSINLALNDLSGIGAQTTVTISGMPTGWSLNQGTQNADGTWSVTTADPSLLTVTTPITFGGAEVLNVSERWTNPDGSTGGASIADNVEAYPASPIFALSANDTLTGRQNGNDEFVFARPIGNDTIYNFNAASDTIDLIGFGVSGYAALAIADDTNGNAVVALGDGETITLKGIDASALSASNFAFDTEPLSANSGTMTIGDGAILPLGGTINNSGIIAISSSGDESDLEILVRGASLTGGGEVVLSDNSQNVVFGGDTSAVLDNTDNTISGAGQLGQGQLILHNEGTIAATGTNALVIDTGANAVINTGTLRAGATGGLVVDSAISGGGAAVISAASHIEFAAASDAAVSFDAGAAGTLKLDQSGAFKGTIAGFAQGDRLDLADVGFSAGATLGYAANALNTGGTLTVSDGTHTTNLALLGQYSAAGFQTAADQGGGTIITYVATQAGITDPTQLTNPQHTA